jgi:hypothetical protein
VYDLDTYLYGTHVIDEEGERFYYQDIGSNICDTQYDVAHVQWGGSWQMPSLEHIKELINNCSFIWSWSGEGVWFKGPNGNSIFLPSAYNIRGSEPYYDYAPGFYRTGTLMSYNMAYVLVFSPVNFVSWERTYFREWGFPVRPVAK